MCCLTSLATAGSAGVGAFLSLIPGHLLGINLSSAACFGTASAATTGFTVMILSKNGEACDATNFSCCNYTKIAAIGTTALTAGAFAGYGMTVAAKVPLTLKTALILEGAMLGTYVGPPIAVGIVIYSIVGPVALCLKMCSRESSINPSLSVPMLPLGAPPSDEIMQ